ncbi:HTH-type transcriptional repressor CytR [Caprobacter fermentans]|uniref:HTH-type transcriptional repressor CytR n=1 Tax=Caproicibacter fermentans TaxID=2576756 RepID=A0A6N8I3Z8_9FIRM|nr:HTH-type transcriptional repressor CytR [Caproicibacter fermentans]
MATIKDIANELNLSVSTVSKGLSGASDVSNKTRQLILNTALKMGYIPKQNRAGADPTRICVFIENMGYERIEQFGYDIIVGFKLEAAAKKWDVSIVPLAMNQESEYNYDDYMTANHYAAGFLLGFTLHNDFIAQMQKTKIPTVLLDNVVYNKNVACVGVDNQQGIFHVVEHLAELGHRNIAMLNGETISRVSQERLDGFRMGMEKCGLTVREELVAHGDYMADCADKFVGYFIREGATAIVCASDLLAHGVLRELYRMGLRVPDDVSVAGFDDLPLASYTTPSLTTIRQNRLAIGKNVCMVMEQIMNGNHVNRLLLMPELVVRESTGKPKA